MMDRNLVGVPEKPLIGRQRELALLGECYEAARRGRLCVALLAGDPGIGKTHLLDAVAAQAVQDGVAVLRGGASEAEGMPPYLPLLEALGQHVRAAPVEQLREETGPLASVLAAILPDLRLRLGEPAESYPLPPEQARLRLYEAAGSFLTAIASPQGLLLLLDDLHWADSATLDLLCHLARRQPFARLLIAGAYRVGEAAQRPDFQHAVSELNRLRVLTTISVGPLTAQDVGELARRHVAAHVGDALIERLYSQSEGNPFFTEELLRGWVDSAAVICTNETWELSSMAAPILPDSIVGAVRERLSRIPFDVVERLRAAAIIGRTFSVSVLSDVAGEEPERMEESLGEAVRAQLLRPVGDGQFTFTHDKVRECLYEEVTSVRRQRLHGFIGRALEVQAGPADAQRLADLAFHFARSGDRERAATYAMQAAGDALHALAAEEAMGHYRTAIATMGPDHPKRGAALLGLGEAAMLSGSEAEATRAFSDAQTWFLRNNETMQAGRAAHKLGRSYWRQESIPEARAAFEFALALLEDQPSSELVSVLVDLGSLLAVSQHQQETGIEFSRRALQLAEQLGDERLIAAAGRVLGNLLVRSNDRVAGIPLLERALELAIRVDDPVEAAKCCAFLALAYFWDCRVYRSYEMALQRLAFAERSHDEYQLRHIYTWLAVVTGVQGRPDEAVVWLDRAQATVERLASPEPMAYLHFVRGANAYFVGELDIARSELEQAMSVFREIGPDALVWYLGWLALTYAALGLVDDAAACMDELEPLLAVAPEGTMPTSEPLAGLTMAALRLRDTVRLARYYPKLLAFEGQYIDFLVDRLLGEIETLRGEWAAAQAHLASAEAVARRESVVGELFLILEAQADLALAQGSVDDHVQQRLQEALELARKSGNQREIARVSERITSWGDSQRPARRKFPAGLSAREVEVLQLVVAGLSNREIAERLVLSEKTIENHLSRIYSKIAVDNRVEATAFAVRNGLA